MSDEGASEDFEVPSATRWLHVALGWIGSIAYFFFCYCILRALLATYGTTAGTVFVATAATAAMTTFIVWLVPLGDLPEIVHGHLLPQRRARLGRCCGCGYDQRDSRERCPECGRSGPPPGPWQLSWRAARRFGIAMLVGIVFGAGLGEWWTHLDEHRFRLEAEALDASLAAAIESLGPFEQSSDWRLAAGRSVESATADSLVLRVWNGSSSTAVRPRSRSVVSESGDSWPRDFAAPRPLLPGQSITSHRIDAFWPAESAVSSRLAIDPRRISEMPLVIEIDGRRWLAAGAPESVDRAGRRSTIERVAGEIPERSDHTELVIPIDGAVDADEIAVSVRWLETSYHRPRAWPAAFASLARDSPGRIHAIGPFESTKIEGWKPRSQPEDDPNDARLHPR